MRQIPPRCLMFQGYDRTVYKTSSVIYTVIISRGALNFRFTCSFNTGPPFRLVPGYPLAERRHRRRGAAPCFRGSGGCRAAPGPGRHRGHPPDRASAARLPCGAGAGARGPRTLPGSRLPPGTPRRRARSRPGQPGRLDDVPSHAPLPPEITG